jgi:hypothetical protein
MVRIAADRDVIRAFVSPVGGGRTWEAVAELIQRGATLWVVPAVAEEIETDGDETERRWREARFQELVADEFLRGCAAGMARRYLDYHPDPRDCRVVAEAECAKMDFLMTLNDALIRGLSGRAENLRIEKPWDTLSTVSRPTAE